MDTAEFEAGVRKVSPSLNQLSKDLASIGRQAVDIGQDFTAAFTVPIVAAFGGSAKAAMDFESSFAGVRKTVAASEEEFAQMASALRELATNIPVNVNELNRLAEAAGAMGIPKGEIVDFTRVMAELGVTTNLTSDQAAESIAKIQNIFGAAGKHTENFASALVALGNAGASTESQILEMATRLASAANTIGLSQADVLGFANAMASLGMEAEAGGTAVSRVFVEMAAAVSHGGDELKEFAKVAGMTSESFATLFRDDPTEAVTRFIDGLSRIKKEGGDLILTLEDLGVSEVRLRDALLRLAGAGDMVRESVKLANEEWQKNSALTIEAQKRFETTEAQLTLLWNRLKDVAITFGNALLPVIKDVVAKLSDLIPYLEKAVTGFTSLPVPVQEVAFAIAGIVAAAGPALIVFGQLSLAGASIAKAFTDTGVATRLLSPLVDGLGTAFRTALPYLTQIVGGFSSWEAVVGLVSRALAAIPGWGWAVAGASALLTLTDTWDDLWAIVVKWFDVSKQVASFLYDFGTIIVLGAVQALKTMVGAVVDVVGALGNFAGEFTQILGLFGRDVATLLAAPFVEAGKQIREAFPDEVEAAFAYVNRLIQAHVQAWQMLKDTITGVVDAVHTVAEYLRGGGGTLNLPELPKPPGTTTGANFTQMSAEAAAALDQMAAAEKRASQARQDHEQVTKAAREAQEKYAEALERFTTGQILQAVNDGLKQGAQYLDFHTAASQKSLQAWIDMGGTLETIPPLLSSVGLASQVLIEKAPFLGTQMDATEALRSYNGALGDTADHFDELRKNLDVLDARKAQEFAEAINQLAYAFSSLGYSIGGQTGQIVSELGGITGQLLEFAGASSKFIEGTAAVAQGIANIWQATNGAANAGGGASALSGALAGLSAGMAFGPWGAAVGAGAGALIGWARSTGPSDDELAAREAVQNLHNDILAQFELYATLDQVLEAGGKKWAAVNIAVREAYLAMGKTEEQAAIDLARVNDASHQSAEAVEQASIAIKQAFEGVAQAFMDWREGVELFNTGFETRVEGFRLHVEEVRKMKDGMTELFRSSSSEENDDAANALETLRELDAETEALGEEFQRVGQYAVMAFSQTLAQTMSLPTALATVQDELKVLRDVADEFGFSSSEAVAKLLHISEVVEVNKDVFESLDGLTQMMRGLGQAGIATKEDFELFGKDAVSLFETLISRGVDSNEALALMAPTLQLLWEHQQKFGTFTDEATQNLIDQGVAVGVVGENQRSVMDNVLQVLIAIGESLGADIPANLRRFRDAGTEAAQAVRSAMDDVAAGATAAGAAIASAVANVPTDARQNLLVVDPSNGKIYSLLNGAWTGKYAEPGTYDPITGKLYHDGGAVVAHTGKSIGPFHRALFGDEVPVIAQIGEGFLNRSAMAAIGGAAALDRWNTDPWGQIGRLSSGMSMPSMSGGWSGAASGSSALTVGDVYVTVQATGNAQQDGKAMAHAMIDALQYDAEVKSKYRRVHRVVMPA